MHNHIGYTFSYLGQQFHEKQTTVEGYPIYRGTSKDHWGKPSLCSLSSFEDIQPILYGHLG